MQTFIGNSFRDHAPLCTADLPAAAHTARERPALYAPPQHGSDQILRGKPEFMTGLHDRPRERSTAAANAMVCGGVTILAVK